MVKLIRKDFAVDLMISPKCLQDPSIYAKYTKQQTAFDERDFFTVCANVAGKPAIG
jgi:hypothetical protein